ncbi:MAG TPA: hypothetical protein PK535_08070, partial [Synergistaceae bacterium]|nr:hypothetical protein [Synergistaceae bacterium]
MITQGNIENFSLFLRFIPVFAQKIPETLPSLLFRKKPAGSRRSRQKKAGWKPALPAEESRREAGAPGRRKPAGRRALPAEESRREDARSR